MAILSKGIKLSYGTPVDGGSGSVSYTDLTNLTEIPALGGTPEKVDTTTLADANKHYINGIKDYGDLSFKFFYDKAQFNTLSALTARQAWKVSLPDGEAGAIGTVATFTGVPAVSLDGVGVGAAMTYTLSIALDSDIEFA